MIQMKGIASGAAVLFLLAGFFTTDRAQAAEPAEIRRRIVEYSLLDPAKRTAYERTFSDIGIRNNARQFGFESTEAYDRLNKEYREALRSGNEADRKRALEEFAKKNDEVLFNVAKQIRVVTDIATDWSRPGEMTPDRLEILSALKAQGHLPDKLPLPLMGTYGELYRRVVSERRIHDDLLQALREELEEAQTRGESPNPELWARTVNEFEKASSLLANPDVASDAAPAVQSLIKLMKNGFASAREASQVLALLTEGERMSPTGSRGVDILVSEYYRGLEGIARTEAAKHLSHLGEAALKGKTAVELVTLLKEHFVAEIKKAEAAGKTELAKTLKEQMVEIERRMLEEASKRFLAKLEAALQSGRLSRAELEAYLNPKNECFPEALGCAQAGGKGCAVFAKKNAERALGNTAAVPTTTGLTTHGTRGKR